MLAEDERWLTIQHVVESPYFKKSPRLRTLLLYLAEQTLARRPDLLSEYNIATAVFERKADFDPDVDTIVRSHMVRLRQKLDQYAVENEANGSICVTVPKGRVSCSFRSRGAEIAPGTCPCIASPQNVSPLTERRKPLLLACGILSFLCLVLLALWRRCWFDHATRRRQTRSRNIRYGATSFNRAKPLPSLQRIVVWCCCIG